MTFLGWLSDTCLDVPDRLGSKVNGLVGYTPNSSPIYKEVSYNPLIRSPVDPNFQRGIQVV